MKVASVKINNILGIEDFEITPKSITRFEGKNSVGKTSALEAIKAALKGGHDATLLRNGADEGQIVILLDDGLEIKKTVTAEKTDLSVKYPRSGIKVDKPQTHLNALTDALSVNPIEFLNAPAKDRTAYLLQAMPLKVTVDDLKGIYDKPVDTSLHAFTLLASIDKMLYDERTGVNRLMDEKRKTAKQLGETLPLEEEGKALVDWSAEVKDRTQKLTEARSDLRNAKEKIETTHKNMLDGIESKKNNDVENIDNEYKEKLKVLDDWRASKMKDVLLDEKANLGEETEKYTHAYDQSTTDLNSKISQLSGDVSAAETLAKQQIKDNATRETIKRVEEEALKHEEDALALTGRLEALQALRLRILSNLPIPGVTVENGQVMKDGVTYDRLNTAAQIDIAISVAKLRAKDLGIITVDGLECLDAENFAAFEKAIQESGLQCFVTRVSDSVASGMEVVTK